MDNSFIASTNINNIYEYINAEMVGNHNINLNNDAKNKKIVKKLTKTVFDKINEDMLHSNKKVAVPVNNFNDMVKKRCVPFLLNKISEDSLRKASGQYRNTLDKSLKPKRRSVKKQNGLKVKVDAEFNLQKNNSIKQNKGQFQSYINDSIQFDRIVQESNQKINDTFKAYSEKEQIFNSHDNISDSFTLERCSIKDDIAQNKLDASVFNKAFADTLEIKNGDKDDSNKDKKTSDSEESSMTPKSYSEYDQLNVRELFSKVLVNQKDHSSNQLESYEGELYLPNLIREIGEEAPIQPLLFQNTTQGYERLGTRSLIIDSGDGSNLDLTAQGTPAAVTNLGSNKWHKLRVNLQETFKIDKLCDIYVKNFTIIGATDVSKCLYFTLSIDEFNIIKPSNNKFLKDKMTFLNTNTNTTNSQNVDVVTQSFPAQSNFVATTNPDTFYNLNITLTNENNKHADEAQPTDGGDAINGDTFKSYSANTNRFILELLFVPRPKQNDIIFDRTPYGSALSAELSNT